MDTFMFDAIWLEDCNFHIQMTAHLFTLLLGTLVIEVKFDVL